MPDGWWRDRRAAARRLLARLQCLQARTENELILVLDVIDPELPEGDHSGVTVRYATRQGPNAADDRIRELAAELDDPTGGSHLRPRPRRRLHPSARIVSAKRFLTRLDEASC